MIHKGYQKIINCYLLDGKNWRGSATSEYICVFSDWSCWKLHRIAYFFDLKVAIFRLEFFANFQWLQHWLKVLSDFCQKPLWLLVSLLLAWRRKQDDLEWVEFPSHPQLWCVSCTPVFCTVFCNSQRLSCTRFCRFSRRTKELHLLFSMLSEIEFEKRKNLPGQFFKIDKLECLSASDCMLYCRKRKSRDINSRQSFVTKAVNKWDWKKTKNCEHFQKDRFSNECYLVCKLVCSALDT